MSPKWALNLISGLPAETVTAATLREDEGSVGWDTNTYLLTALVNSVREGTFANMQVRTEKKLKPPEPIPLPGAERKQSKPANAFVRMAQAQLAARNKE